MQGNHHHHSSILHFYLLPLLLTPLVHESSGNHHHHPSCSPPLLPPLSARELVAITSTSTSTIGTTWQHDSWYDLEKQKKIKTSQNRFERVSENIYQLHTEKSFRNLIKSIRNQIVSIIFLLIWKQTYVRLVPNQSENGKYNLNSFRFNKISKRLLCVDGKLFRYMWLD